MIRVSVHKVCGPGWIEKFKDEREMLDYGFTFKTADGVIIHKSEEDFDYDMEIYDEYRE